MSENSRVVFREGMFLQPQHFQQMERSLLNILRMQLAIGNPTFYGLTDLAIDTDALMNSQFTLVRSSGIFPDGTIFSVPGDEAAIPSRSFAKAMTHDQQACDVFLALPLGIPGKINVAGPDNDNNGVRFKGRTEQVIDDVLGTQKKEIEVGLLNVTILFSGESLDNYSTLKIGRLVRNAGGQIEPDEKFVPPLLSLSASPYLLSIVRGLLEVLLAKSSALSQGRRQVEGGLAEFGGTEETAFRLLQVINTYTPLLNYYHFSPAGIHPFDLFTL
ncbi:MAG: type VI secretion system baseplate subunit TssK, partial [Chitinivibrionales bacterium]|nr:type VI secretion system baseplate subunit TssK [Chitinivibrionales bacterium]